MVEDKHLVFIIDDDSSVRTSLSRLLHSAGYATEVFSSATEYLQRQDYDGISCLILDLMMPGIGGTGLYRRLIEKGSDLPVIFLSAHGDLSTGVQAMKLGAEDFLQKPVDESVLLGAVSKAMTRHQSVRKKRLKNIETKPAANALTPRELEILQLILGGSTNRQIADLVHITNTRVLACREKIKQKTGTWPVADENSI